MVRILVCYCSPKVGVIDALLDVNYKAPIAAATACQTLGYGHWIQSSTQATNAARGGQVKPVGKSCWYMSQN
jgi:hypothetical protein